MLVISAVLVLAILIIKELISSAVRKKRIADLLYIPVLPLIILFGIAAYEKISQMPSVFA